MEGTPTRAPLHSPLREPPQRSGGSRFAPSAYKAARPTLAPTSLVSRSAMRSAGMPRAGAAMLVAAVLLAVCGPSAAQRGAVAKPKGNVDFYEGSTPRARRAPPRQPRLLPAPAVCVRAPGACVCDARSRLQSRMRDLRKLRFAEAWLSGNRPPRHYAGPGHLLRIRSALPGPAPLPCSRMGGVARRRRHGVRATGARASLPRAQVSTDAGPTGGARSVGCKQGLK